MKKLMTLTILALAASAFAQTTTVGAFTVVSQIDPLTDADTSFIASDGLTNYDATLYFACKAEGLRVFFSPDKYIGSTADTYPVTYRLDKDPAVGPRGWNPSTDGTSVFVPRALIPAFVAAAKNAKTIIVQVRDYNDKAITDSFDLMGLAAALDKLPCATDF